MSDAKRHTRFIEEDLVEARPKGPPPSPLQSTSQKLSGVEEQSASPPSRFPAKRTQKRTGGGLVPVLAGSPWKHYENRHRLKFGHSFAVVTSTITRRPRMIRSITGPSSDEQIHRLRHLFHPNIVESLKLYTCPQEGYFLVSEFLPTTLEHLYQAPIYPTEPELGSILHQVLTGINFLLTSGLVYEQVSAANLLSATPS
ncbi:uncharacterized protein VDAG_04901 [Verticillium dahliae VdLs.17]|uniref:Protein kinase domain-containing protein n=1 Tax=Verticillium dahliae (strain VdLs.17 / ATCC MYA-4575 / FGSC 10137) TaxID=498257 RepID=G2X3B6_VERDV|nr:uncharacterized protein VDAG_04901 [Verticillium dahliae VdLs.17]EGY23463.1 hypothetical protein VDAG_04901 [Verticillium dahliae VdLs.17]KAH6708527.1 hypothetical protein EV126DRAFT_456934 [Verticillium dahliae]